MPKPNWAEQIRSYVAAQYIKPARRRGEQRIRVVAGDVHRGLRLTNLVPNVCQVLDSKKFRDENDLELEEKSGPPSGMGTRVAYVYRILDPKGPQPASQDFAFEGLHGLLKDVFQSLGGGKAFLTQERASFYGEKSAK
jgi:hypothetical protein